MYWPGTSRKPTELQFIDSVTWLKSSHAFKVGGTGRFYYIRQTRGAGNPFGIYPSITFSRLDASFTGNDANGADKFEPPGGRLLCANAAFQVIK